MQETATGVLGISSNDFFEMSITEYKAAYTGFTRYHHPEDKGGGGDHPNALTRDELDALIKKDKEHAGRNANQ